MTAPAVRCVERFNAKVQRTSGCWEWVGARGPRYGSFRLNGRSCLAHRVAWEFARGPIPDGLCVCHACDNHRCVRPDHLFLGTHRENMRDRDAKGRRRPPIGSLNGRAKLTTAQVDEIRLRHADGGGSLATIGAKYGISSQQVWRIVRGAQWKHTRTPA